MVSACRFPVLSAATRRRVLSAALRALVALPLLAGCVAVVVRGRGQSRDDQSAATRPAPHPCTATPAEAALTAALLPRLNALRAAEGLTALSRNAALDRVAQHHSCDMAASRALSHRGSDGAGLPGRLLRQMPSPSFAVENVGLGPADPDAITAFWMQSVDHRDNILSPAVREAGLGVTTAPDGRMWWTMILIRP